VKLVYLNRTVDIGSFESWCLVQVLHQEFFPYLFYVLTKVVALYIVHVFGNCSGPTFTSATV